MIEFDSNVYDLRERIQKVTDDKEQLERLIDEHVEYVKVSAKSSWEITLFAERIKSMEQTLKTYEEEIEKLINELETILKG